MNVSVQKTVQLWIRKKNGSPVRLQNISCCSCKGERAVRRFQHPVNTLHLTMNLHQTVWKSLICEESHCSVSGPDAVFPLVAYVVWMTVRKSGSSSSLSIYHCSIYIWSVGNKPEAIYTCWKELSPLLDQSGSGAGSEPEWRQHFAGLEQRTSHVRGWGRSYHDRGPTKNGHHV